MAKDGQVCFHRRLFADPVKLPRCTTDPVRPLDGINKDVGGAKLLLMATSVYPVDCACYTLWNNLPNYIVTANDINQFKNRLDNYWHI